MRPAALNTCVGRTRSSSLHRTTPNEDEDGPANVDKQPRSNCDAHAPDRTIRKNHRTPQHSIPRRTERRPHGPPAGTRRRRRACPVARGVRPASARSTRCGRRRPGRATPSPLRTQFLPHRRASLPRNPWLPCSGAQLGRRGVGDAKRPSPTFSPPPPARGHGRRDRACPPRERNHTARVRLVRGTRLESVLNSVVARAQASTPPSWEDLSRRARALERSLTTAVHEFATLSSSIATHVSSPYRDPGASTPSRPGRVVSPSFRATVAAPPSRRPRASPRVEPSLARGNLPSIAQSRVWRTRRTSGRWSSRGPSRTSYGRCESRGGEEGAGVPLRPVKPTSALDAAQLHDIVVALAGHPRAAESRADSAFAKRMREIEEDHRREFQRSRSLVHDARERERLLGGGRRCVVTDTGDVSNRVRGGLYERTPTRLGGHLASRPTSISPRVCRKGAATEGGPDSRAISTLSHERSSLLDSLRTIDSVLECVVETSRRTPRLARWASTRFLALPPPFTQHGGGHALEPGRAEEEPRELRTRTRGLDESPSDGQLPHSRHRQSPDARPVHPRLRHCRVRVFLPLVDGAQEMVSPAAPRGVWRGLLTC